jgi:RNA polymerase sigma factor (TIGR02999 family)
MSRTDITQLLDEARQGRREALEEVTALVYAELRAIAARRVARHAAAASLEPSDLVHEAFLRLVKQRQRFDSRGHFFAIASSAMLRILLDHHRARLRDKRGGGALRVTLSGVVEAVGEEPTMVLPAFAEALGRLEELDARSAEIAKLRLLWGLTDPEIATALDLSLRTVERQWQFARRWLAARLTEGEPPPAAP